MMDISRLFIPTNGS